MWCPVWSWISPRRGYDEGCATDVLAPALCGVSGMYERQSSVYRAGPLRTLRPANPDEQYIRLGIDPRRFHHRGRVNHRDARASCHRLRLSRCLGAAGVPGHRTAASPPPPANVARGTAQTPLPPRRACASTGAASVAGQGGPTVGNGKSCPKCAPLAGAGPGGEDGQLVVAGPHVRHQHHPSPLRAETVVAVAPRNGHGYMQQRGDSVPSALNERPGASCRFSDGGWGPPSLLGTAGARPRQGRDRRGARSNPRKDPLLFGRAASMHRLFRACCPRDPRLTPSRSARRGPSSRSPLTLLVRLLIGTPRIFRGGHVAVDRTRLGQGTTAGRDCGRARPRFGNRWATARAPGVAGRRSRG